MHRQPVHPSAHFLAQHNSSYADEAHKTASPRYQLQITIDTSTTMNTPPTERLKQTHLLNHHARSVEAATSTAPSDIQHATNINACASHPQNDTPRSGHSRPCIPFHQSVKRRAMLAPSQTLVHSSIDSAAPLPSHLNPRQIGTTIANGSCETHSQCDNRTSVRHDANRIMSYAWATVSNAFPSLLSSGSRTHPTSRTLCHCKSMTTHTRITRSTA